MSWSHALVFTGLAFVALLALLIAASRARPRPGRLPPPVYDPRAARHRNFSVGNDVKTRGMR